MDKSAPWPLIAILAAWALWFGSWIAVRGWSKRTEATPQRGAERLHSLLVYLGFALLILPTFHIRLGPRLWAPPQPLRWFITALAYAGFGLVWWARLHLGRDWSWNVTRKQDHRLVDTGPYAAVRHPIYAGLLIAGVATAALEAKWPSLVGLALFVGGFWLKARLEERFLSHELGELEYRSYTSRTGMLLPRL
jgi:protein-S-isoprenylcysteine O-methyltransferase Ste14